MVDDVAVGPYDEDVAPAPEIDARAEIANYPIVQVDEKDRDRFSRAPADDRTAERDNPAILVRDEILDMGGGDDRRAFGAKGSLVPLELLVVYVGVPYNIRLVGDDSSVGAEEGDEGDVPARPFYGREEVGDSCGLRPT